jgi:EmrB/QacA subfamily drug resistance transporter
LTREQRLSVVGISLALFLGALDQTIVTTALPRITEELGGLNYYAWVVTAYLLASVLGLPFFGRLVELFPAKWVLLSAVSIFLAGSVLSGLAPGIEALVAFRALQGFGGGGIFALSFSLIGLLFSPRERGRMQGMLGGVFGLSSVAGPWIGGLLTDLLSWRWIFYINVPLGIVAIVFFVAFMPRLQAEQRGRFDLLGVLMLALWVIPMVLALSLGGSTYPWISGQVLGLAALMLAALLLFLWWQRRSTDPLIELRLFQTKVFRWAVVGSFFFGGAFFGAVVFLPLYLVHVKGFSATNSGLSITPLILGVVAGSTMGGQLASRFGRYKLPLLLSLFVGTLAFAAFALNLRVDTPLWQVIPLMVVIGLCLGPSLPLYTLAVQNTVPRKRLGTATSTLQFVRQVGSTASVALMGTVLAATVTATMAAQMPSDLREELGTLAIGGESGNVGNAIATVQARFVALEEEVTAAVDGNEAARQALLTNPSVPTDIATLLQAGSVRDQVGLRLAEALEQVEAALAGDANARDTAQQNPLLPAEVKANVQNPPASAAARGNIVSALRSELQDQEAAIVESTKAQILSQLQTQLRARAEEAVNLLTDALHDGITAAVRRVYVFTTVLLLISFCAALLIPDVELGGAPRSGRKESLGPSEGT